ncbi:MAG TPA: polysaccharide biosynthesis C-terminal domain-containing protein [Cytophagales bacterium]|nr:polysaccharide biosynthesis C-terminal domain-containing protein [Cytophagales bacterium]
MSKFIRGVNKKYLVDNALSLSGLFFNIAVLIFSTKYIVVHIGVEIYGINLLMVGISTFAGLVGMGYLSNLIVILHKYQGGERSKIIGSYFTIQLLLGILGALIYFAVILHPGIVLSDTKNYAVFKEFCIYYMFMFLMNHLTAFFEALLFYNYHVIKFRSILDIVKGGVSNLLICLCVHLDKDYTYLFKVPLVITILCSLATILLFMYKTRIRLDFSTFKWRIFYTEFRDSISFWSLNASFIVLTTFDSFFISKYIGDMKSVVYYGQSYRMMEIVNRMLRIVLTNKSPKLLQTYAEGNISGTFNIFRKMLTLNISVAVMAGLLIPTVGYYLLQVWLGSHVTFDRDLLIVFSFLLLSSSTYWVFWTFFNIVKFQKKTMQIALVEIVCNLSLSYILIIKYGVIGLAIASLISNLISIGLMLYLFKQFKLSVASHSATKEDK